MMQHHASEMGAEIIAIGGVEDHVHVLARFPATLAISDLVGRMKAASSYLAAQVVGHPFQRQGAYGAFTVSASGLAKARACVLNQETHHRAGTTRAALEATQESFPRG